MPMMCKIHNDGSAVANGRTVTVYSSLQPIMIDLAKLINDGEIIIDVCFIRNNIIHVLTSDYCVFRIEQDATGNAFTVTRPDHVSRSVYPPKKVAEVDTSPESLPSGPWYKFSDYHWYKVINGERLHYWPTTGKYQFKGQVYARKTQLPKSLRKYAN